MYALVERLGLKLTCKLEGEVAETILLNAFFSWLEVCMANLYCLRDSCMLKDRVEGVFRKTLVLVFFYQVSRKMCLCMSLVRSSPLEHVSEMYKDGDYKHGRNNIACFFGLKTKVRVVNCGLRRDMALEWCLNI